MTVLGLLVLVYALVAIAFIAGLVGRWAALGAASRATEPPSIRTLEAVSTPFGRMVTIGSMLVLAFGVAAAIAQGRPFLGPIQGAPLDRLFVSLVLYLSIAPLVPFVFIPKGKVFEAALEEASARGTTTPELTAALADPASRFARIYEAVAVTIVLVLMLTRPF